MSRLQSARRWRVGVALLLLLLVAVIGLAWRWYLPAGTQQVVVTPVLLPTASALAGVPLATEAQMLDDADLHDWRLYRWRDHPAVLVIQFPGLLAQGQALNRAAALLEKGQGRRDRVLDDADLRALLAASGDNMASFFLGHDYASEGLARFFDLARVQGIALNGGEQRLLDLLLRLGLLSQGSDGYAGAGGHALVSFSALQVDDPYTLPDEGMDEVRRASVLRHELSHGRFFTDAAYRAHCWRFWRERLTEAERQQWHTYLAAAGYDGSIEELMVNETQALLMHTPDARDVDAESLGMTTQVLASQRERFRQP